MNQMNELNQAFEEIIFLTRTTFGLFFQGMFGNFTSIGKVFKVGILSSICVVKINCVLLYLSND